MLQEMLKLFFFSVYFYFIAAQCYAQERNMPSCGVRLSVCLSVAFVYSVKTSNHILNFSPSNSHTVLVFFIPTL